MIPKAFRPQAIFLRLLMMHSKHKVINGPFEEQLCGFKSFGSAYFPKILGTYEMEIYTHLLNFLNKKPSVIIDAGAAEGFYAVAFALRCSESKIYAMESDALGAEILCNNKRLNACNNIKIIGDCNESSLNNILTKNRSFLFMDIEGAENECLDPLKVPRLKSTDILVETHDYFYPGTTEKIRERFIKTHTIIEINGRDRAINDFPYHKLPAYMKITPKKYVRYSLLEHRPCPSTWLSMTSMHN